MTNQKTKIRLGLPMITIILVGFTIGLSTFYNKKNSFDWKDFRRQIVDSIQVSPMAFHQFGYGESGYSSGSKRLKWIARNASISELNKMIEHPNTTIKLTGYLGLLKKEKYPETKEILMKSLQDTSLVKIAYECMIYDVPIKEHFAIHELRIDSTLPPSPPSPDGFNYKQYLLQNYNLTLNDEPDLLKAYYKM